MKLTDVKCAVCDTQYQKPLRTANENKKLGYKNYCSPQCMAEARKSGQWADCAQCERTIWRSKTQLERSQSGRIFCSKHCATTYNNQFKVGNSHPNYKDGAGCTYRKRALETYGSRCRICGYDIEPVLQVHHIDSDRTNNNIKNLVVLCPTHHKEVELGICEL